MPLNGFPLPPQKLVGGILNTAQFIIVCLDSKGGILYVNPYFESISGYRMEEVRGNNWFDIFITKQDEERLKMLFRRAISGTETHGNVNAIVTRTGEQRFIEWHDTTLEGAAGEGSTLLAIGHDFTDRLRAERELEKHRDSHQVLVAKRTEQLVEVRDQLARQLDRQNNLLSELESREEIYRALAFVSPVGIFRADTHGAGIYFNRRWCEISGLTEDTSYGNGWTYAIHSDERDSVVKDWMIAVNGRKSWHAEIRLQRPDGDIRWVICEAVPERDSQGRVSGYAGTVMDITERKQSENALVESEHLFRGFFEHSNIGLAILHPDGRWLQANRQLCNLTGYDEAELLTRDWPTILHPGDRKNDKKLFRQLVAGDIEKYDRETLLVDREGRRIPAYVTLARQRKADGSAEFLIVTVQDITEQKRLQAKLHELAIRDALTGVYNRTEMNRRLNEELVRAGRYGHHVAIFMLDVDHFKRINDTRGHRAGDAVLRLLVTVLEANLRRSDYLARYGGEEFLVILPETTPEKAAELAERLRLRIAETPLKLADDLVLELTVSIGIAAYPTHGTLSDEVIEAADRAMYQAKREGRNRIRAAEISRPA